MDRRPRRVLMAFSYYDHQMHLGVVRYARQAGWVLDTTMAHYGTPPSYWQGDGVLTFLLPERRNLVAFLKKQHVPVVALNTDVMGPVTAAVALDNAKIGRLGAEHLLARGIKNCAFFKVVDLCDVREREKAFRNVVLEAGGNYFPLDWHAASSRNPRLKWFDWLKQQLRKLAKPLGVMAQSDNRACYVINACEAAGLAVPEQVAVVGVDNDIHACELAAVPITSVDSNRENLAFQAAALLDRLMRGQRPPTRPILVPPTGVVVRRSTDVLAIEDVEVAKALTFVWQNFHRPIHVDDVVAATAMSRCGLYYAFEKYVGRTIRQELVRKRIEHAKILLATSAEKIHRVGQLCGFRGGEQFCRVFSQTVGATPSQFRRQFPEKAIDPHRSEAH
jgi:LacI family transcriptional regulator